MNFTPIVFSLKKFTIVFFSLSPFSYLIFEELVRLAAELLLTPSSADHPCLDSLCAFSFPSKLDDLVPQEGFVIQLWPQGTFYFVVF